MGYSINEHQHRESAWVAATGARASKLCRFKVSTGVAILEECGFVPGLSDPSQLPPPTELDVVHCRWRNAVIAVASKHRLVFSHGIAAKLINGYLKCRFVCAHLHEHENVKGLHPPIDAVLLKALGDSNVGGFKKEWRAAYYAAWSKFDSEQYQGVIDLIRQVSGNNPLWMIEEYWQGHQ